MTKALDRNVWGFLVCATMGLFRGKTSVLCHAHTNILGKDDLDYLRQKHDGNNEFSLMFERGKERVVFDNETKRTFQYK